MLFAEALPMLTAPWISSDKTRLFTALLELVSDFVDARLATVAVENVFDLSLSWVKVSLVAEFELLLAEKLEPSAHDDDLALSSDADSVAAWDVPNVSETFLVVARVAVKPLFEAKSLLAVNVLPAVNEVV